MENESNNPEEFSKLVAKHYDKLTKSEKMIAVFIREHQDEAAFMPAGEIAAALEISEPTMARFARSLGFENYPALRESLQEKFRNIVNHSARLRSRLDDLRSGGDIYEQLVTSEIDFLTESLQTLNRNAFNKAVELLRTHYRVFVLGLGPAISLVDLLEIRLTRSARNVIPLKTYGRDMLDPLLLMNKDDLLFAFGFHSINPFLQVALDQAALHGTPVIFVTDTLGDLVGDRASVILSARRGPVSGFHSMTVPMTIVNTLLLAMSAADQETVMTNLDRLDQLRDNVQHLNSRLPSAKKN